MEGLKSFLARLPETGATALDNFLAHPATPMLVWCAGIFLCALVIMHGLIWLGQQFPGNLSTWLSQGLEGVDKALASGAARILNNKRRWWWLWLFLVIVVIFGTYAPPNLALIVLGAGLVWMVMVYRLWASDEEDRAHEVKTEDRRIGLNKDLTNEIWFNGLGALVLVPLIFYQVNLITGGHALTIPDKYGPQFGYFAYSWAELQRIAPLLQNLDLIGVQYASDINPRPPLGNWTAFGFRILGDVLVISVVIKLVEILARMRTGVDLRRQEEKLIDGDMKAALSAIGELSDFVLRFNRLNALGRLIAVADPAIGDVRLNKYIREAACQTLYDLSSRKPALGTSMLQAAKSGQQGLIAEADAKKDSRFWADAQNNLAIVLFALGRRLSGEEALAMLRASEAACRAALTVFTEADLPQDWARTQNSLGNVLAALGKYLSGEDALAMLRASEAAYRAALTVYNETDLPQAWAEIQNNLGAVLRSLGDRLSGEEALAKLRASEAASRAALTAFYEADIPLHWAMSQGNLGNVMAVLGVRLPHEEALAAFRASEAAYRAALVVFTEADMPQDWAGIQNNLGAVLRLLGDRLSGEEALAAFRASVAAYQAALTVFTEADMPQAWAGTQCNLGLVLSALGERLCGEDALVTLRASEAACRAALTVYTETDLPQDWARSQNNLGNALRALGERMTGEDALAMLRTSEAAYRAALTVFTEADMPLHWAMSQGNLGNVLRRLGERLFSEDALVTLRASEAACRAALVVFTEADMPRHWAETENNLKEVLKLITAIEIETPS